MTNRLLLVDSMNLVYRVAHVPSFTGLTNSKDEQTGILHGFLTSLLLFAKYTDEIVVVWDTRSERKRKLFSDYKAKRDDKDPIAKLLQEELTKQLVPLKKILKMMGIVQYQIEGYEADEIIGCLALLADQRSVILSEDKDYLQLVSEDISIWQPIRKRIVTTRNFSELYHGLTPKQYFTFRTYTGDSSDEIPGVPSCGEKTGLDIVFKRESKLAERLFKKHGTSIINQITERNKELMQITEASVPAELLEQKQEDTLDLDRLELLLNRYELSRVRELWIDKMM